MASSFLFLSRRLQPLAAALLCLLALHLARAIVDGPHAAPHAPAGVRGQIAWDRS